MDNVDYFLIWLPIAILVAFVVFVYSVFKVFKGIDEECAKIKADFKWIREQRGSDTE